MYLLQAILLILKLLNDRGLFYTAKVEWDIEHYVETGERLCTVLDIRCFSWWIVFIPTYFIIGRFLFDIGMAFLDKNKKW